MALQKINVGTNEDGSPRWHYISDGHVVLTGPENSGVVALADGTEYDVSPEVIEVDSHEHAKELAMALSPGSEPIDGEAK